MIKDICLSYACFCGTYKLVVRYIFSLGILFSTHKNVITTIILCGKLDTLSLQL